MKNQIRVYVSHSIRGRKGADATEQDMKINNDKAIEFGKQLRELFPCVDFYVPGDHDEFVLIAYLEKFLTEKQILDVDCIIVRRRHFVIVFAPDDYLSRGMVREIEYAGDNCIPVIQIPDLSSGSKVVINRQLLDFTR